MMNPAFSQLLIFYYIVDYMSFSKAATHLKCSKAHVSKQIQDLERMIGSRLIQRNTRSLALTCAGETIFEHARVIVEKYRAAECSIANLQTKATRIIPPKIQAFVRYLEKIHSYHGKQK